MGVILIVIGAILLGITAITIAIATDDDMEDR